jgi:hypothetical protein
MRIGSSARRLTFSAAVLWQYWLTFQLSFAYFVN